MVKRIRCLYELDLLDPESHVVSKFSFEASSVKQTELLDVPERIKELCEDQLLKLFGVSKPVEEVKPEPAPKRKPVKRGKSK